MTHKHSYRIKDGPGKAELLDALSEGSGTVILTVKKDFAPYTDEVWEIEVRSMTFNRETRDDWDFWGRILATGPSRDQLEGVRNCWYEATSYSTQSCSGTCRSCEYIF